jgi:hypothetical protein
LLTESSKDIIQSLEKIKLNEKVLKTELFNLQKTIRNLPYDQQIYLKRLDTATNNDLDLNENYNQKIGIEKSSEKITVLKNSKEEKKF